MSEMQQMEAQFSDPTQQAAILVEQQRVAAIKTEQERQKQI